MGDEEEFDLDDVEPYKLDHQKEDKPKAVVKEKKETVKKEPEVETLAKRPVVGGPSKILLYGGTGSGKTRSALLHFRKFWEKDNTIRCKYIDTDKGLEGCLEEEDKGGNKVFPSELIDCIDHYECNSFRDVTQSLKEVFRHRKIVRNITVEGEVAGTFTKEDIEEKEYINTREKDFIIFDSIDKFYEDSQEEYTMQVFGDSLPDYIIQRRRELEKENSGKPAMDGWKDWVPIKMLHNRAGIDRITKEIGCHVICITTEKEVDTDKITKKEVEYVKNRTVFTKIGFAPVGEKRNPHRFDRIYHFSVGVSGWYYESVKCRGGNIYEKKPIGKGDIPEL